MGQPRSLFHFIFVFFKQTIQLLQKSIWKNVMTIQYMAPVFKPTTSRTWVVSHNHQTRASHLVPSILDRSFQMMQVTRDSVWQDWIQSCLDEAIFVLLYFGVHSRQDSIHNQFLFLCHSVTLSVWMFFIHRRVSVLLLRALPVISAVWHDVAKFRHFGEKLKRLANIIGFFYSLAKLWTWFGKNCLSLPEFSLL